MTEQAQQYVDSLDLKYKAEFIPQSQSRNKDNKHPSLNWRVTLGSIETDYMQGIGHLPGYKHSARLTVYEDERQRAAAETGKWSRVEQFGFTRLPAPKLIDVLYSLVMDSDVIEYDSFEDWADTMGMNSDSIKDRKIYDACMLIALKLRQLINLDDARKAFQDY